MSNNPLHQNSDYTHANASFLGRVLTTILHSSIWRSVRRWCAGVCPLPVLKSDVTDVIYATWWVGTDNLPPPPQGYRYAQHSSLTPFTILTDRHGHLGPKYLKNLRRLLPSPLQSNWRLYVVSESDPTQTPVLFTHNALDSLLHVVGARLSTDSMQPQHASIKHSWINASFGVDVTHPHMDMKLFGHQSDRFSAPPHLSVLQAMDMLVQQEWALSVTTDNKISLSHICMDVNFDRIIPLKATYWSCPFVQSLQPQGDPMVFVLPEVPFEVLSEKIIGDA